MALFKKQETAPSLWMRTLPYSQMGSMIPAYDPLTDSIYVSDGWGTPFRSIKLRQLNAQTGEETASIRLNNCARTCCFLDDRRVLVALDSRLVALDRTTLAESERWDKRIPRYTDHMLNFDRTVLLMNLFGPNLHAFQLDSGRSSRKVAGSCLGLYKVAAHRALVCCGKEGKVMEYGDGRLATRWDLPAFKTADFCPHAHLLALGLGNPFTVRSDSVTSDPPSRDVCLLSTDGSGTRRDFRVSSPFLHLSLSGDGSTLFLADEEELAIFAIGSGKNELRKRLRFRCRFRSVTILPERNLVVCRSFEDKATIEAYQIDAL